MATVLDMPKARPSSKKVQAGTINWFNECVKRSKNEIVSEVVGVTPGLASELLKSNHDNRGIRPIKVGQFAADMRKGAWALNGEPIIVAKSGEINDGQHRLTAVIDANTVIPMLFVFGIDRDARLTVDQGSARSASDFLGMEGVEHAAICAVIARLVIAIERENYQRLYRENEITNAEIRARVAADPAIGEAAHYASTVYRFTRQFAAPGVVGAAFYLLNDVNPVDAREYMDRVCIGEGLKRTDPAFAVRDALYSLGRSARGKKLEAIFRGWTKHRCNQPLKIAKVLGSFPALI